MATTVYRATKEDKLPYVRRSYKIVIDDYDASGGDTTIALDGTDFPLGKIAVFTIQSVTLDAADSTVQFQGSMDGSTWFDVGGLQTLAASATYSVSDTDTVWTEYQAVYTVNSVTAGTVRIKGQIKE